MPSLPRFAVALLTLLALAIPLRPADAAAQAAAARAGVATADAPAYLGDWTLTVQSDMGAFAMDVAITDAEGRLAANVSSDMGEQEVERITREGESLLLEYQASMQGETFPVAITLTPDGAGLKASLDFAGGMFVSSGTATKK